jgi:hypothetical protein
LCSYYQDTDLSVSNHQRLFFRKNLHGPLLDRERTIVHMNHVLNDGQAEAYNTILTTYPNIYRDQSQSQPLSGYQLTQSVKSDVLRSLRNSFVTNMTRRDFLLDGSELDLEEASTPYNNYEVRPGITWIPNCYFLRP